MFELLALAAVLCLFAVGFALFGVLGAIFWLLTLPLRILARIVLLPFQILGWVLGLVLTLVALPVVILGLVLAGAGLVVAVGLAGVLALVPLLVLALPALLLVWALRSWPSGGAPRATA